jgi:hypothetical protein
MSLHVVYRSTGGENKKERPPYYSKVMCLLSLLRSIENASEQIDVVFLNDGAVPEDRLALMSQAGEVVELPGVGRVRSYWTALGLLAAREWDDGDLVYFVEDDYLHLPEALGTLIAAGNELPWAPYFTLYDCPDRYTRSDDADGGRARVFIGGGRHWRTVESTTHTFAARARVIRADSWLHLLATRDKARGGPWLRRSADPPKSPEDRVTWRVVQGLGQYKLASAFVQLMGQKSGIPRDRSVLRHELRLLVRPSRGRRMLLGPMPSLATHMEELFLAPLVDWEAAAWETLRWGEESKETPARDVSGKG